MLTPTDSGHAECPAERWRRDTARRSLDELFSLARKYKSSDSYFRLLKFVAQFRFYSPFNAMLVHLQMPGASYVAPAIRWLTIYGRRIKADGRPLVILQPMGPVMFVFDVSDTTPEEGAPELPREVLNPFEILNGRADQAFPLTAENARRDGVYVGEFKAGSQAAGRISVATSGGELDVLARLKPKREYVRVRLRYEVLLNQSHSDEEKFSTLVHELAHLYCGHLGTPNPKWWPDRRGLSSIVRELEAESVCYIVCTRAGIETPSVAYLSRLLGNAQGTEVPSISLARVMDAAGLIEQMGRGRLKPRQETGPDVSTSTARTGSAKAGE